MFLHFQCYLHVYSFFFPSSTLAEYLNISATAFICETVRNTLNSQTFLTRPGSYIFLPSNLLPNLTSPTHQATAIENYVRLCVVREDDDSKHNWFNKANTTGTLILIWLIGLVLSGSQFLHQVADGDQEGIAAGGGEVGAPLPFEYCRRKNKELLPSGVIILTVTLIVPLVATFFIYLRMHMTMQRFVRQTNFKPNYWFSSDFALAKTNFYSFVIFILFWAPFAIVACLATSRPITNQSFYNCAWVGMSKSCFYNIIYCLTHRHFRNAYMNLFNYCCCKTSFVATSRRHRNDGNSSGGGGGGMPGTSSRPDVRVHIIPGYNMYSYTSPQRRDVHEL